MADDAGDHGSARWSRTGRLPLRNKCRGLKGGGAGAAVTEGTWSGGGAQSRGGREDSGSGGLGEAGTVRWSHALTERKD